MKLIHTHITFIHHIAIIILLLLTQLTIAQEQPLCFTELENIDDNQNVELMNYELSLDTILDIDNSRRTEIEFSPDETMIASADNDILIWDLSTDEAITTLTGHTQQILSIKFHPTKPILASASRDGTVRIWDLDTEDELHKLTQFDGEVNDLVFSNDGETLYIASTGKIALSRLNMATYEHNVMRENSIFTKIDINPSDTCLVLLNSNLHTSDGNNALLLNLVTGYYTVLEINTDKVGYMYDVSFNSDGTLIAIANGNNVVHVFDVVRQEETIQFEGGNKAVEFIPHSNGLISATNDYTNRSHHLFAWHLQPLFLIEEISHENNITDIEVSQSGSIIATSSYDGIIIWSIDIQS